MNRTLLAVVGSVVLVIVIAGVVFVLSFHSGSSAPPTASTQIGAAPQIPNPPARPEFERAITPDGATRIYHTLLPGEPGDEWSESQVSHTKKNDRPYLGNFRPGAPVTLTLSALPPHKLLRISFDLFIMRSWDGSSETYGFTRWDLSLADGRTLLHTTFNNMPYFGNNQQAFPDSYPARSHFGCTLAAEMGTLGVTQSWGTQSFDVSSVYHLSLPFPHTDGDVTFNFESTMEKNKSKFFGLTNLEVDALPELPACTPEQLATLWNDLASPDPQTFFTAQWKLVSAGEPAVDFIAKHLDDPIPTLSTEEITALVPKITSDDDKNTAFENVVFQGPVAVPLLEAAGARTPNPAFRLWRAWDLVKRYPYTPQQTRNFRAKYVLQAIHSPDADALADKIPEFSPPPKSP